MISNISKRKLIDALLLKRGITGNLEIIEFLKRVWDLDNMPSTDSRFKTGTQDIWQHCINNDDYSDEYLFNEYFNLPNENDEVFIKFIEEIVHPLVRSEETVEEYVALINRYISRDGYILTAVDEMSGYPIYKCINQRGGVREGIKNLIFAADGPKPEIVIEDSISNNIKIVKNEEYCLIYDRAIPSTGLLWNDLAQWWVDRNKLQKTDNKAKNDLYKRLYKSLDSEPEKKLFSTYYNHFSIILGDKLPALIPQVYLHYDPYTARELNGVKRLPRQRMDFLLLLSSYQRIVIEVDGVQHYSEKTDDINVASPELYSDMVSADRELRLRGYELYRFGGYELTYGYTEELIINFFTNLIQR